MGNDCSIRQASGSPPRLFTAAVTACFCLVVEPPHLASPPACLLLLPSSLSCVVPRIALQYAVAHHPADNSSNETLKQQPVIAERCELCWRSPLRTKERKCCPFCCKVLQGMACRYKHIPETVSVCPPYCGAAVAGRWSRAELIHAPEPTKAQCWPRLVRAAKDVQYLLSKA
jgi:hypothetical protein